MNHTKATGVLAMAAITVGLVGCIPQTEPSPAMKTYGQELAAVACNGDNVMVESYNRASDGVKSVGFDYACTKPYTVDEVISQIEASPILGPEFNGLANNVTASRLSFGASGTSHPGISIVVWTEWIGPDKPESFSNNGPYIFLIERSGGY